MKRRSRALFLATTALVVGRMGFGCASQGADVTPSPMEVVDGSVDAAPTIPATPDADASTDADADADALPTCSSDGWCHTKLPTADSFEAGAPGSFGSQTLFQMNSVWVAPDHQAWAVTAGGHVLRWDGTVWSVVAVLGTNLHSIWGTSATDIWIAGDGPLVLHGTVSAGNLTLTPVPIDTYQSLTTIWGTSPSNIWVLGSDGAVFHLEAPDAGAALVFVPVNLPSDYPSDYNQFRATALWGTGSDVWIAGSDQTYCDPVNCEFVSELVVRKWKGGNDGEPSWDRIRIPMGPAAAIPLYSNITRGVSTSDGVQVAFINGNSGHVLRVANGNLGAWTLEALSKYVGPEGIWATDSKNVWLAGPSGIRHYDGTAWQIGRLALTPDVPLLKDLHSILGAGTEMWSVGDDVALHRTVTP